MEVEDEEVLVDEEDVLVEDDVVEALVEELVVEALVEDVLEALVDVDEEDVVGALVDEEVVETLVEEEEEVVVVDGLVEVEEEVGVVDVVTPVEVAPAVVGEEVSEDGKIELSTKPDVVDGSEDELKIGAEADVGIIDPSLVRDVREVSSMKEEYSTSEDEVL